MKDDKDLYLEEIHRKLISNPEELHKLRIRIKEFEEEYYLKTKKDEIKHKTI